MRIALIGGITVPKNGGLENYMFELSKAMQKRGHEVWIICQGDESRETILDGVRITQLESKRGFYGIMSFLKKATRLVLDDKKGYDVINYHRNYFTKWLCKDVWKKGIKTCFTNHSFAIDNPKHGLVAKIILWIVNYTGYHNIKNYISVSEYGASLLKKRYGNDSFILHGGVDMSDEHESPSYLQEKGLKDGKYLLTICRVDPVKGLEALIDGFMKFPKEEDVQLAIGGNINTEYGLSLVERAKSDKRIIFLGPVYGDDKTTLLNHNLSYCLVSSSEGFPIALLEAMGHGNTCIVSDIPANKEAINDEDGLWCKTGDSDSIFEQMNYALNNREQCKIIGEHNQERVLSNFTWPIIAKQFEDYCNNLQSGN